VTWAVLHGTYDAQIFTDDREKAGRGAGGMMFRAAAPIAPEMKPEQKQEQAVTPAAGDRAGAGAELGYWLGSLVKSWGLEFLPWRTFFPFSERPPDGPGPSRIKLITV